MDSEQIAEAIRTKAQVYCVQDSGYAARIKTGTVVEVGKMPRTAHFKCADRGVKSLTNVGRIFATNVDALACLISQLLSVAEQNEETAARCLQTAKEARERMAAIEAQIKQEVGEA